MAEYLIELKDRGVSVLLIEQKLTIAMTISDRALVMGHGSIVFQCTPDERRANGHVRKEWLEVRWRCIKDGAARVFEVLSAPPAALLCAPPGRFDNWRA